MSNRRQNITIVAVVIGFLIFLAYTSTPPPRWIPTWHENDGEAYGGEVTRAVLKDLVNEPVQSSYRTLYEMMVEDSLDGRNYGNLLIVANGFDPQENDWRALMRYLREGNTAMISTTYLGTYFKDSLGAATAYLHDIYEGLEENAEQLQGKMRLGLRFTIEGFPEEDFEVEALAATYEFDTEKKNESKPFETLSVNEKGGEVLRRYKIGQGQLYLHTNSLLLSNYYLLDSATWRYSSGLLSMLPANEPVTQVEFYQVGRQQSSSILRFMLSEPALRAAVYLSLVAILLFLIFEARRKQRIIPVIEPFKNSSVEFAETLGQLYYNSRHDHLNLGRKRVNYFLEYIRHHYYLPTNILDDSFARLLAERSDYPLEKVRNLLDIVKKIKAGQITENQFLIFEKLLHQFYQKRRKIK